MSRLKSIADNHDINNNTQEHKLQPDVVHETQRPGEQTEQVTVPEYFNDEADMRKISTYHKNKGIITNNGNESVN